ncbi:MAG: hypothetical protein AABZ57_06925 [Candidatus Margulisiibacteriota bacterium]
MPAIERMLSGIREKVGSQYDLLRKPIDFQGIRAKIPRIEGELFHLVKSPVHVVATATCPYMFEEKEAYNYMRGDEHWVNRFAMAVSSKGDNTIWLRSCISAGFSGDACHEASLFGYSVGRSEDPALQGNSISGLFFSNTVGSEVYKNMFGSVMCTKNMKDLVVNLSHERMNLLNGESEPADLVAIIRNGLLLIERCLCSIPVLDGSLESRTILQTVSLFRNYMPLLRPVK